MARSGRSDGRGARIGHLVAGPGPVLRGPAPDGCPRSPGVAPVPDGTTTGTEVAPSVRRPLVPGPVVGMVRGPRGIRGDGLPAPHTPRGAGRHDRRPPFTLPLVLGTVPTLSRGAAHPLMPGGMVGAVPRGPAYRLRASRHRTRPARSTRHEPPPMIKRADGPHRGSSPCDPSALRSALQLGEPGRSANAPGSTRWSHRSHHLGRERERPHPGMQEPREPQRLDRGSRLASGHAEHALVGYYTTSPSDNDVSSPRRVRT